MNLHDAAESGDLDQVQTLVESGAAVDGKDEVRYVAGGCVYGCVSLALASITWCSDCML